MLGTRQSFFMTRTLTLITTIAVLCSAALAQNASLSGLLTDPHGLVIAGATIKVTGADTGLERAVKTNDSGYFVVAELRPGRYIVVVNAAGFQSVSRNDVVLNVSQQARIDFALKVGSTEQTVSVEGGAPLVNTESA